MGFAITPASGFPPVSDDGFPRFIQFRVDGDDVGNRSVENLNFTGDVSATVSSDGSTVDVVIGNQTLSWQDVPGDYTLEATDAENGLSTSGGSGQQTITIPGDEVDIEVGSAVLVFQKGAADVVFAPVSGVTLLYRSAFAAQIAGQYGIVTLIKTAAYEWMLCGDMATA